MAVNEKRLKAMIEDAHAHEGAITNYWIERYFDEMVKRREINPEDVPQYDKEFREWVVVTISNTK